MSDRHALEAAQPSAPVRFDSQVIGQPFHVKRLTGAEFRDLLKILKGKEGFEITLQTVRATLCGADGALLYESKDVPQLAALRYQFLEEVQTAANAVNMLGMEEAQKIRESFLRMTGNAGSSNSPATSDDPTPPNS